MVHVLCIDKCTLSILRNFLVVGDAKINKSPFAERICLLIGWISTYLNTFSPCTNGNCKTGSYKVFWEIRRGKDYN